MNFPRRVVFPRRRTLARALIQPAADEAQLAAPWAEGGEVVGWLSRAAWALALISIWRERAKAASPIVWLPAYFCDAVLHAARRTSARFAFYPVTAVLEPDWRAWEDMLHAGAPDIVLLKHYFGRPAPVAAASAFCAQRGAWLVEDASDVLRPTRGVGADGDVVIYSPHDHLPIVDGALLVVRRAGPSRFTPEQVAGMGEPAGWPGQLAEVQEALDGSLASPRTGMIPRLALLRGVVWGLRRIAPHAENRRLPPPALAEAHRRLLTGFIAELAATAHQRQRYQCYCDADGLNDRESSERWMPAERPMDRAWSPSVATYRPASEGGPLRPDLMRWPRELPRELGDRNASGGWTRWCLPLDRRPALRPDRKPARRTTQNEIKLVWNGATRAEWEGWLVAIGRSNLLQSWAYGEAKAATEGWEVRRGVFRRGDTPVGLVQALQKRSAGIIRITRINRGPLWLSPLSPEELVEVWTLLSAFGDFWRGRLLSVAPELPLTPSTLGLMAHCRMHETAPWGYESVWVDLGRDLDVIRQTMSGKWRRWVKDLDRPEKKEISLRVDSDAATFEWMMLRYAELMESKDFTGAPIPLLRELRKQASTLEHLLVVRAFQHDAPIAGILLGLHGAAATYLVGWNSAAGRKAGANQFLFWHSIKHLSQAGLRWFDLGGISEEETPGITAFKLGLSSDRYELIGEYLKL